MNWKGRGKNCSFIKVHLPGETEENYKNPHLGRLVFGLRFELGFSPSSAEVKSGGAVSPLSRMSSGHSA
jgi:hypothetical protein